MNELIQREFARLHVLLSPERTRASLSEAPPLLDAKAVGALAGVGLAGHEPDLLVSVYLFESVERHAAAVEQLQQAAPQEGIYHLNGTNGLLLFFGYVHMSGPDDRQARFHLAAIASAFAGDE